MTAEIATDRGGGRRCAWCLGPIPAGMRRDAECCSTRCRQRRHRFVKGVGGPAPAGNDRPLRLAYADPPYPNLSERYYRDHPDYAGEVDHRALIAQLQEYDGWALSTSSRALQAVLGLCPPGVHVAAWFRGERPTRSEGPLNAWEPVIYFGGRQVVGLEPSLVAVRDASRTPGERVGDPDTTRRSSTRYAYAGAVARLADPSLGSPRRLNALVWHSRARTSDPNRVVGAKPAVFCRWMFDLLGAQPQDDFTDLFPGSGGVSRAWRVFASSNDGGRT